MYNHYIPQSDGSYRRSTMPDSQRQRPRPQQPAKPKQESPAAAPPPPQNPPRPETDFKPEGIMDFLRKLLPRQIDTADLMIMFLLLLMNQNEDDSFSPLLTIALYFLL